jgi:chaperonin cofactor prefoldin
LGKAVEEAIELTIKQYSSAGDTLVNVAQRDLYERLVVRMNELEQQVQTLAEALATAGERGAMLITKPY